MSLPSRRTIGGDCVVRWRSEPPISTICFSRPWSVASLAIQWSPGCCVARVYALATGKQRRQTARRESHPAVPKPRPAGCFSGLKDSLAKDFFERGLAFLDLLETGHAEADHALLDRLALQLDR